MSAGVCITNPLAVTDAMLLATDVPETDHTEYAGGTTYALGDRVRISATHTVWESLQAGNVGHAPASSPTWWIQVGATNRWSLFDGKIGTATTSAGASMYYRLLPGVAVTEVGLFALANCLTLRLRVIDPTYGTVYDQTADVGPMPRNADPWEFCFGVWTSGRKKVTFTDLPAFPNAELRLDFSGTTGVSCGALLFGQGVTFGRGIKYGAKVATRDYSKKAPDNWGNIDIQEGAIVDRLNFEMVLTKDEVDALKDYLDELHATKVLVIASTLYDSMATYCLIEDFETLIAYPNESYCSMQTLGMV